MIEFENENERELAAAAKQFLAAMIAKGYTAKRCHEAVTNALISFRQSAAVQARRQALHVVGAVQPGDGATRR